MSKNVSLDRSPCAMTTELLLCSQPIEGCLRPKDPLFGALFVKCYIITSVQLSVCELTKLFLAPRIDLHVKHLSQKIDLDSTPGKINIGV